jgi:hypothetical protein
MTPFEFNIPDEYLLRIGRINVAWGALETVVDLALARLGGFNQTDPRSAIITAHMAWPLKMDILEALAHALETSHPKLRNLAKVKPFLKAAQEGRNQTAHGHWTFKDGQVIKVRMTARGKLRFLAGPVTIDELDNALTAIIDAGRAVLDVVFDAADTLGAVIPKEEP